MTVILSLALSLITLFLFSFFSVEFSLAFSCFLFFLCFVLLCSDASYVNVRMNYLVCTCSCLLLVNMLSFNDPCSGTGSLPSISVHFL